MQSLDKLRKTATQHAGRELGLDSRVARYLASHHQARGFEAEIMRLPVDSRSMSLLFDIDPGSPTFGDPVFMVGYDAVGDPDRPVA